MIDIIDKVESIYNSFGNTLIVIGRDFTVASKKGRIVGYSTKHKDIYKIVYPITGYPDIDERIKMHEYGHIYCGHFEGIHEELDSNLIRILKNKDTQLIKLVNENCGIDYAEDILEKIIKDPWLNHMVHNAAMDMEVNSSILDKNDIEIILSEMNRMVYEEYLRISENGTKMPSNKELVNLHSKFNMKGVVPEDLDFTPGLTYPDYLVLIILNFDKFLRIICNYYNDKDIIKTIKSKALGNESGDDNGDESQGDGDGNGGENENIPKTKEEFEEMMKNAKSGVGGDSPDDDSDAQPQSSPEGNSNSKKPSDNDSKNSGNGSSSEDKDEDSDKEGTGKGKGDESDDEDNDPDHGTDSRDEADDNRKKDLGQYSDSGGNGRGLSKSTAIRDYVVDNDPLRLALEEIIRDFRHKVIKRDFIKDVTHKYNRRILGQNNKMISPTYRLKVTKTENPTILFGVDVSGSMDTKLVDRIITSIRREMKRIDRSLSYNIAAWDTELCEYYRNITFETPIPKLSCGGGTRLAGLFDLFKKDFGRDSILIIISDFGDDLNEWHSKEINMNGYSMYGLKYGNDDWYGSRNMPDFKNFKVRKCY